MIDDVSGRLLLVACILAAASLWLAARRRSDGRFASSARGATRGDTLTARDLGHALGERATFVQFSTATCATCPQVSRVLGELSDRTDGVGHVEIAADARMDLVRRFGVHRTPTVLLLGPHGQVLSRAAGPMASHQAAAALDAHLIPGEAHV
jgi:thioredoxin-like negative regulator of GroEL